MADSAVFELERGNKEDDTAEPQINDARDWASPGDPANAENWPLPTRAFPTALVGAIAFLWYVYNQKTSSVFCTRGIPSKATIRSSFLLLVSSFSTF